MKSTIIIPLGDNHCEYFKVIYLKFCIIQFVCICIYTEVYACVYIYACTCIDMFWMLVCVLLCKWKICHAIKESYIILILIRDVLITGNRIPEKKVIFLSQLLTLRIIHFNKRYSFGKSAESHKRFTNLLHIIYNRWSGFHCSHRPLFSHLFKTFRLKETI